MANMNVSYDEIENAAVRLTSGREELESQLNSLREYISNLVSSGFVTDQASGAFNSTYEQFTTAARTCVGNLDTLATNLRSTAEVLRSTDQQIAAQLQG